MNNLRDITKRRPLAELLPLPNPIALYLETHNVCNFGCKFCPLTDKQDYAERVGGFTQLDEYTYGSVLSQIKFFQRPLEVLRFYHFGEPLLDKRLPDFIKAAKGLAKRTEVTTNATALTEEVGKRLIDSELDYIRVSIYSMYWGKHKRITGNPIDPMKIRENLIRFKQLKGRKPYLFVKMLDPVDPEEVEFFKEVYTDIADEVGIEMPHNSAGYDGVNILHPVYGDKLVQLNDSQYPYQKEVCPYPFYTLAINANGDVTVCCVDWRKDTCIGNVKESSIIDLWNGEAMQSLRRMHLERRRCENNACRNCSFIHQAPDNLDEPLTRVKEIP